MRKDLQIVEDTDRLADKLQGMYIADGIEQGKRYDADVVKDRALEYIRKKHSRDNGNTVEYDAFDNKMEEYYKQIHDRKNIKDSLGLYRTPRAKDKAYRDNKVIDMAWTVLTHPIQAVNVLNPGGFDQQKRMGYMIAAYQNPANNGISWNELEKKSISELKDLCYTEKDLAFFDTQLQFYRQNAAAASLIGVFAVNKIAHAFLGNDNLYISINDICGKGTLFEIAGMKFKGYMPIEPKYDTQGNLIGKTLGSLVGASADAVKDPVLNLMNINMNTVNILTTLVRMGMPFDDAALFLSQDIISKMLRRFERGNIGNYTSIQSVISDMIAEMKEDMGKDGQSTSTIDYQPISKEELIDGLKEGGHKVTDYKVILAFQKVSDLADAMRKPTTCTRYNSIASAVGPLVIDNLIQEDKLNSFDAEPDKSTGFYTLDDKGYHIATMHTIFKNHPMLDSFHSSYDLAKMLFKDMPAGCSAFADLLEEIGNESTDLHDKIMRDRKLLDKLCNFFTSYLLVSSGLVDPKYTKYYIEQFPKEFMKIKDSGKYKDNAFVNAITLKSDSKAEHPYLYIGLTGMDNTKKEDLSSAWNDFYHENPKVALQLFAYNFFRAGINFSPKTFMALLPTSIKEKIERKDKDSKVETSYVDTFRKLSLKDCSLQEVIDQFIRNNWDDNKLVPWRGGKNTHFNYNPQHTKLTVTDKDINAVQGQPYIKTKVGKQIMLWKLDKENSTPDILMFNRISALGNNGEYLEISKNHISQPLAEADKNLKSQEPKEDDIQDNPAHPETNEAPAKPIEPSEKEQSQNALTLADMLMNTGLLVHEEDAKREAEKYAAKEKDGQWNSIKDFISSIFKQNGLNLNDEETHKKFNELC